MTRRPVRSALFTVSIAGVFLLSACGKGDAPAPAKAPAAAATAATAGPNSQTSLAAAAPMPANASTAAAPAVGASVVSAVAVPVAVLSVAKVTLGSEVNAEHQVAKAADHFSSTDKSLYASVATEGRSGGATINAKWAYLEGTSQLVSSISQSIATDGPAVTTFKVKNPDLWPEGKYQVEISLDGKPVAKQGFEIKKD